MSAAMSWAGNGLLKKRKSPFVSFTNPSGSRWPNVKLC